MTGRLQVWRPSNPSQLRRRPRRSYETRKIVLDRHFERSTQSSSGWLALFDGPIRQPSHHRPCYCFPQGFLNKFPAVNDAPAYHYAGDAQSGNDITDTNPKIFPDLIQRSLRPRLSRFGPRYYLYKTGRRLTSDKRPFILVKGRGTGSRRINFPAAAIPASACLAPSNNRHVPELAEQAAVRSRASINFTTQYQPDANPGTCPDQDKVVSPAARAVPQMPSRFIHCSGGRIVFDNDRHSSIGFPRTLLIFDGQGIGYRHVTPAQMRSEEQFLSSRIGWAGNAYANTD